MNQFEMPEVFGKLLLEMPLVLKMYLVSTCSIYLTKQRDYIVFDWRKKVVCTTTIKSLDAHVHTFKPEKSGRLWHKYTGITI